MVLNYLCQEENKTGSPSQNIFDIKKLPRVR